MCLIAVGLEYAVQRIGFGSKNGALTRNKMTLPGVALARQVNGTNALVAKCCLRDIMLVSSVMVLLGSYCHEVMPARAARIRLDGYSDAEAIEGIFASSLVDVAYVEEITPRGIFVTPDTSVNLNDPADFEWVKSVIQTTLEDYHQNGIRIELEPAEPEQA